MNEIAAFILIFLLAIFLLKALEGGWSNGFAWLGHFFASAG